MIKKCPDCDLDIETMSLEEGEVVACQGCGLELLWAKGELSQLTLDGFDWGE
jgi:uncharacterized paraquat-inducible protein A